LGVALCSANRVVPAFAGTQARPVRTVVMLAQNYGR